MSAVAPDLFLKPFGEKAYQFAYRPVEQDRRITVLEGAVRSAKTWALHPKIIQLCDYPVKGLRVLGGVTKSTIKNNVLNDLFELVGEGNYSYNTQSGEVDLFGVQWLVVGAKDEGSEKVIRGSTIGVYVGDELTLQAPSFVKMVLNRMSVEGARAYGTTNPDTPFHYVYTDLMNNKALLQRGEIEVIHFELADNPNLPEWYPAYLESLYPPGSLYHQRFVKGLWVTGEGAIYKDVWSEHLLYDNEPWKHEDGTPGRVAPPQIYDPGAIVDRSVAIDCGVDHVQVYGDFIDDGTNLWMDREYWWDSHEQGRQKTDGQYKDDLEMFMGIKAPSPLFLASQGYAHYEPSHRTCKAAKVILPPECASFDAELTQAGIWHVDADNEVLDGIKSVSSMMALGRLRFHRKRTKNTVQQLQTYMWNPLASARGVEEPLKKKDDGPDMVRYKVKTDIAPWRLARGA